MHLYNFCVLMFLSRIFAEILFLFFSVVFHNVQIMSFASLQNLYFLFLYLALLIERKQ